MFCPRWRGPRRAVKAINNYMYEIEDLCNGITSKVHVSKLKYYVDDSFDKEAIMSHGLRLKTGMFVQRLQRLEETGDGPCVFVSWKEVSKLVNTTEPIASFYKDLPELFKKLLQRKNAPAASIDEAKRILYI